MLIDSQQGSVIAQGITTSPDWVYGGLAAQPADIVETILLTGSADHTTVPIQGTVDEGA